MSSTIQPLPTGWVQVANIALWVGPLGGRSPKYKLGCGMYNAHVYSGPRAINTSDSVILTTARPYDNIKLQRSGHVLHKNFFVRWFTSNGRDFPWRTNDITPFAMLVTEILLRQTQARAVAKLWENFVRQYPDAESIAGARRSVLIRKLKVLGFGNQRAEALQHAANYLIQYHHGTVPKTLKELLKVPHIGHYAARAILCFAFGQKIEIVDTNILRFFGRYYGLDVKPDIRRNPVVWSAAKQALPGEKAKALPHNYGLLDFTAEVCRALQPKCATCPLQRSCTWGRLRLEKQ
jgi:A/G-specific adenine glycosylase